MGTKQNVAAAAVRIVVSKQTTKARRSEDATAEVTKVNCNWGLTCNAAKEVMARRSADAAAI